MLRRVSAVAALLAAAACGEGVSDPPVVGPASLDQELRASFGFWGVMPIAEMPVQSSAMVDLGQSLFFDKELSGNRDVSCATCHEPLSHAGDGLALAVGTGGSGTAPARTLGAGRQFVPRNAPTLLNTGLGLFYTLWDGRVNEQGGQFGGFQAPQGIVLPSGLRNIVAAQAMLPVLNRVEMRGNPGDTDVYGNANELASISDANPSEVWKATMTRLVAIQEYVTKFNAAYPGVPTNQLGFQHAANALAAFQMHNFSKYESPFDRYLKRDNSALTDEQKRGGILFFGKARCSTCHSGALLGGQQFANIGVPQIGPGVGAAAPLDIGRAEHIPQNQGQSFYRFSFRVPPLRNVELTAPYMHNGAFAALETVVRHYTNPDSSLRNYDVSQLPAELRGTHHNDNATITDVLATLDGRLRFERIRLSEAERAQVVAFLKALTDPAARNLGGVVPASVPSGLAVRQ